MKKEKINLFVLAMLSCAFVVSVRNIPTMAEVGMQMIFFGFIAAICFFLPTSFVSAELATGWPKEGGIFVWVHEAFGEKWGFFASWLQWTNMCLSVISMLYFVGGSFAFVIAPHLAVSKLFLIGVMLIVLWTCTLIGLKGIKANSFVSTCFFLSGVLFPGLLIIILGLLYFFSGNVVHLDFSFKAKSIFPDFKHISSLVLALSFARTFTGIEASAAHAGKVDNPSKNYPIAIFIVVILGLCISLLGAFSVAVVVPREEISLIAGVMEAFKSFLYRFHMQSFLPYLGILVALGAIGGANAWLMGPVEGLFALAKKGALPKIFQKENKHNMPKALLITQGIVISIIGVFFMTSPSVNIAFWISVALSTMIYLTMYFMMFLSALKLRYSKPNIKRSYRFGKKNGAIWTICLIGMTVVSLLFFIAIFPPDQLPDQHRLLYFSTILLGIFIVYIIPFVIEFFKKDSWKMEGNKNGE